MTGESAGEERLRWTLADVRLIEDRYERNRSGNNRFWTQVDSS